MFEAGKRVAGRLVNTFKAHRKTILTVTGYAVCISAGAALAITAPSSGDFAYDVYDIAVNKILAGPIGFVGGAGAMAVGAVMAIQQKIFAAVPCILGGAVMLNADSLVTSLGMII